MRKETVKSAITISGSIAGFYYAKHSKKDILPCVLIGGFLGAFIGEAITKENKKLAK